MSLRQTPASTLPAPSSWQIIVSYGGRDTSGGTLTINSVVGNTVLGTLNFRGVPISIRGSWNEQTKQIRFQSPYAIFRGNLSTFREPGIMHYILNGNYASTVGADFPGAVGKWQATTATFH